MKFAVIFVKKRRTLINAIALPRELALSVDIKKTPDQVNFWPKLKKLWGAPHTRLAETFVTIPPIVINVPSLPKRSASVGVTNTKVLEAALQRKPVEHFVANQPI